MCAPRAQQEEPAAARIVTAITMEESMSKHYRRGALPPLSLLVTAVLTLGAGAAGAVERTANAGQEAAALSKLQGMIEVEAIGHGSQERTGRMDLAITLSKAPVAHGSTKAEVLAEQSAFIGRLAGMAPSARVIGSVQLVAHMVFVETEISDMDCLGADRSVLAVSPNQPPVHAVRASQCPSARRGCANTAGGTASMCVGLCLVLRCQHLGTPDAAGGGQSSGPPRRRQRWCR
jgi:hypothetical protein